jgi:hypothetical protein
MVAIVARFGVRHKPADSGLQSEIQQSSICPDLEQQRPHAVRIPIQNPNEEGWEKDCEHRSRRAAGEVGGGIPDYDSPIKGITHRQCGT